MIVTDATLKLCLERGIGDVEVLHGAESITDNGILEFCFGETMSLDDSDWRYLDVKEPSISDEFVERLIKVKF